MRQLFTEFESHSEQYCLHSHYDSPRGTNLISEDIIEDPLKQDRERT